MTPFKRNLSRLLFIALVLALGTVISGVIYYFKMDSNEDTLNTLLFRELKQIEVNLHRSFEKVRATTEYLLPDDAIVESTSGCSVSSTVINSAVNKLSVSADLADLRLVDANSVPHYHFPQALTPEVGRTAYQFSIADDNQALFSRYKQCKNSSYSLHLTSGIDLSLKQRINRFQTVALIDKNTGDVISFARHKSKLSNETELLLKKIGNVHSFTQTTDGPDVSSSGGLVIEGTTFIDTTISDTDLRIYIHPVIEASLQVRGKELYLIGVIEKSAITEQKLKLAPTLLMWLILSLLFLIAVTPLLKLRFISTDHAIQPGDKSQIVLGLIIATGIVTIGLIQELFYNYFEDVKTRQLELLHQTISQDFIAEANTVLSIIRSASVNKREGQETADCVQRDKATSYYQNYICNNELRANAVGSAGTLAKERLVESVAVVNSDTNVSTEQPILYISEHLVYEKPLDLTRRDYIKAGLAGQFWQLAKSPGNDVLPFFVERVFNIEDGRKNTMIAIPFKVSQLYRDSQTDSETVSDTGFAQLVDYEMFARANKSASIYQKVGYKSTMPAKEDEARQIIIAGTRFGSLVDRVLPNNFGFAVLDESGLAIFHSDDSLSRVENFFTETNQNTELLIAFENDEQTVPMSMKLYYKGSPHHIVVGPMRANYEYEGNLNTIPWRLVVFYNPESLQINNMILVFMAVFLFMLIIIPGFMVLRYLSQQRFWLEITSFDPAHVRRYKTYAILLFATGLCVQFQTGLVLPFTSRLVVWSCACVLLCMFFIRMFRVNAGYLPFWKQPLFSLTFITLVLFIADTLTISHVSREYTYINVLFSGIGFALVILAVGVFKWWGVEQLRDACLRRDNRAIEKRRFNAGYVWYISGLFYLASVVPASTVAYTAHDYLLQRQANFEVHHVEESTVSHQFVYFNYLSFLNAASCSEFTENKTSLCSLMAEYSPVKLLDSFYLPAHKATTLQDCGIKCNSWVLVGEQVDKMPNHPDGFFNAMFSITPSDTDLISHLSFAAKRDMAQDEHHHAENLLYRADILMMAAVSSGSGPFIFMVMFLGVPFGLYLAIRQFMLQRLMGEHLQDQFRMLQHCSERTQSVLQLPRDFIEQWQHSGYSQLWLNATRLQAEKHLLACTSALYESRVIRLPECLQSESEINTLLSGLALRCETNNNEPVVVAISAVEQVSSDAARRMQALAFLYALHNNPRVVLIVVAETAPLYRLLNPASYQIEATTEPPQSDEKAAWSKLFSEFVKHYAWSALQKTRMRNPYDADELLNHECNAWPEIRHLRETFAQHTRQILGAEYEMLANNASAISYNEYWEPEQILEFMQVHAGALYRRKWEECTRQEKLVLWKVANGASINPANSLVIERLVRRSYLFRDKGWYLINESFRQFIITAESEQTINLWLDNTSNGAWSVLRIPIFALLLVLVVIFVYSSGSSLNTLLSVATAALGLIPLLLKNLSLLKSGAGTDIE